MNEKARSIPFRLRWDDAPVDISPVFEGERPAGRHGFLAVRGDRLEFEDGTEARFWGTNVNSGACFPEHCHAEKVARRLAKFGVNLVRFHQLDAEWSTPNIFHFTKGAGPNGTRDLDPRSMERLDYFVWRLKEEGISLYLDMLTYRKFKSADGVEAADKLGDAAKPYSNFSRRLIELQKELNHQLWTHYNPYTRCAYKDDPAIVLTEVANENELFLVERNPVVLEPYRTELEGMYRTWAQARGTRVPKAPVDFTKPDDDVLAFLVHAQAEYYREMMDHLRSIGVRVPVAGTNWSINAALLQAEEPADFMDSHWYWCSWQWQEKEKRFENRPLVAQRDVGVSQLTFSKVHGKPFFVSEWDDPWPNEWRAESPLYMAAVACLQGWSGMAIHTYRYDNDETTDMIGNPITSEAIGGVYYRGGVFDTFNDPAKFGLFYHAALLMRRGDVRPAENAFEVKLDGPRVTRDIPVLRLAHERSRICVRPPGRAAGGDTAVSADGGLVDEAASEVTSDTGQMYRSWEKRVGWIDTPRTAAVYGFLGGAGEIRLTSMRVAAESDFAVIAVSSLTDDAIGASGSLLLTAVGRSDNAGCRYNADHTVQEDRGGPPSMAEVIRAEVRIRSSRRAMKVWAVSDKGFYVGQIPVEQAGGELRFRLGESYPSLYYLIREE